MHYAIQSHNVNIVNMLLRKYRHFGMERCNLRNVFGLRPMDLEFEEKEANERIGSNTKVYSMRECKRSLGVLVKYFDDLRQRRLEAKRREEQEELERRLAAEMAEKKAREKKKRPKSRSRKGQSALFFLCLGIHYSLLSQ